MHNINFCLKLDPGTNPKRYRRSELKRKNPLFKGRSIIKQAFFSNG